LLCVPWRTLRLCGLDPRQQDPRRKRRADEEKTGIRRTSNVQHRTPNAEQKRRKEQIEGLVFLSSVRRWMFSVRCSRFPRAQSEGSAALWPCVLERSGLGSWSAAVLALGAQRSSVSFVPFCGKPRTEQGHGTSWPWQQGGSFPGQEKRTGGNALDKLSSCGSVQP